MAYAACHDVDMELSKPRCPFTHEEGSKH